MREPTHSGGADALRNGSCKYRLASRLTLLSFLTFTSVLRAQNSIPVVFDSNMGDGIDQEFALALALQSPELNVRVVTVVGDDTENRMRLAWKVLGLYGRRDIALGRGASESLLGSAPGRSLELGLLTPQDLLPPGSNRDAISLIVDTVLYSPGPVTLIATGPLTNIALAIKVDPRIKQNIARIVVTAGAFDPPRAEYNIQRDQIAAEIVFSSGVPITVVSRDVSGGCMLGASEIDRLRGARNPASQFLVQLIELAQKGQKNEFPILHDPLAVAVSFQPVLINAQPGNISVDTTDPHTSGKARFLPATELSKTQPPKTALASQADCRRFLDLLIERLAAPPRSGGPAR
ncbi:MAG TPA: nucleoside hydrolase [Bryobacteraceae bacterium]|nr:nucleoside hydrolase [Bryobacteraceae bacterium]